MNNLDTKPCFVSSPIAILAVAVVYAALAKASFLLTIPPGNITPIFPAAGLALAVVIILGPKALIGVWIGSFLANTLFFFDSSMSSVQVGPLNALVGAIIGIGATLSAAAGALFVRRFCKGEHPLQSGKNVLILIIVGAFGCCMISPTFGVFSLLLGDIVPAERLGYSWVTWWVGDAAGTLVVAPLVLAWQQRCSLRKKDWSIIEVGALGSTTLLVCFFVFFKDVPCEYALLPLLLWAAFRFGMRGTSTTGALVALLATIGTSRGSSPFVGATANESLLFLNSFLGVTVTSALFMAGMMEERKLASERMFKLNRSLRAISECNQALIHASDEMALLNRICRLVTDIGGYRLAWVGFVEHDENKSVKPVAQAGFEEGGLETLQISWVDTEHGRGPIGTTIRTAQPCVVHDLPASLDCAPRRAEASKHGPISSLVLPLKTEGRVLGVLNIYSEKPNDFDSEETNLLSELADDLTYGIVALRIRAQQGKAETALRESEERLRLLGDNLPDSYVYQCTQETNGTSRFLCLSAGVEKLHGLKVDDVLRDATLLRRQIASNLLPALQAAEATSLSNMTDLTMELRMRSTSGQWRWIQVCSRPRHTSAGQVVWDGVATDITAIKQADGERLAMEQRLAESEREYRELVMLANSIILRWMPDGRITFLNEFGQRFFGYSAEEILGQHIVGTLVPENETDGRDLRSLIRRISDDPQKFERNINENMRRTGERVWIDWTNKVVADAQGHIKEILSIGSDITERKQAEEQVRILNENLSRHAEILEQRVAERTSELAAINDEQRAIFESAGTGIVLLRNRIIVRCNRKLEEIAGYGPGELAGKSTRIWYPDEASSSAGAEMVYARLATGETLRREQQMARKDGTLYWVRLSLRAFDPNDPLKGAVGIVEDITDEREAAEKLRQAMEAAQAADRIKSAFLATMSHELRTPLNSIIGFTGIMLQGLAGPLNPEQHKQMSMVQKSSRHLLALINDVLDISKIEAGQLSLARASFELTPSIKKMVKLITPLAEQKGIDLEVDIDPKVGAIVADQRRLEQVIMNLLGNAIKFTEKGRVRVACWMEDNHYLLSFIDTGIGMKPEDIPGLFQPFHQIDSGLTRKHEGTGLGLSICKKIIDLMGGSIDVASQWGQGSAFTMRLPRQPGETE